MDTHQKVLKTPAHLADELGPTTLYLLEEIIRMGIPYRRFQRSSLLILGYGKYQRKLRTAVADSTSGLGMEIASDKEETKQLLDEAGFPVPRGIVIRYEDELREAVQKMKFPLVIKPLDGNQGRGVTTNVDSLEKALFAFDLAKSISREVIVEDYIRGEDYRLLVVGYKLVAATKRTPALIVGDGKSTIHELIAQENMNPDRGSTSAHVLALIKVDAATEKILTSQKLTLESILPAGEILHLKSTANISAGGTATDVTDRIHPSIKFLAERVARLFTLDICGVDIMTTSIAEPLTRSTGAIIEVNAGPGLRMHTNPTHGIARNVAVPVLEMLFPGGVSRIPIVAIGRSENKLLCELLANLARHNRLQAGYSTHNGAFIDGHSMCAGSPAQNAVCVLSDTTVEFAVIECDHEDLDDHGFDKCNVAIITQPEHVHIAHHCFPHGYVIVNADVTDPGTVSGEVESNIAVYSISDQHEKVHLYCREKGIGAWVDNDRLNLCINGTIKSVEIGQEQMNHLEALVPALLAGYLLGWDVGIEA